MQEYVCQQTSYNRGAESYGFSAEATGYGGKVAGWCHFLLHALPFDSDYKAHLFI